MLKMLLRGRVLYGTLCQLFSLICISFSFSSKVDAAPVVTVHVANAAFFQNEHPVTLTGNGIPLRAVFKAIKKQTGYAVMYSTSATSLNQDEKVNVNFKETPLDDVLGTLFKGRNLEWQYSEDVLLIRKKEGVVPKKSEVDSVVTPVALTGKVTDASGQPIQGVTVQVKGKSLGTTTDADGKFSLPKVRFGEILVMSSVGFERREIPVKGKTILAQMNSHVSGLDETVITAYGTTTKRLATGNISTVKAEDIARQPINNPLLALQGRVPGLAITQSTGFAGSGVSVQIQGQNSIGFNVGNDPLYVIDGVPYPSRLLYTLGSIQGSSGDKYPLQDGLASGSGSPLSFINPADIESIDILKDADATSIYGSRAANGAILITTKKGQPGQTKVDINLQSGWSKVPRKINLLNSTQYLQMRHEAKENDDIAILPTDYDINGTWDTSRSTDWQKELIGSTAHYTDVQATISGGNLRTQYLVSSGYHKETTVLPGNLSDQKGSIHFSITDISPNKKFRLNLSGTYLIDNNKLIEIDLTQQAIRIPPIAPSLYNTNGTLNWATSSNGASTWTNPLAYLQNEYSQRTNNLTSNAVISYQLLPGLDLKSSFGYTNLQSNEIQVLPLSAFPPETQYIGTRISKFLYSNINSWIIEPQLNYQCEIAKGKLDALLGSTIHQNNTNLQIQTGYGYSSDLLLKNIGFAAVSYSYGNTSTYKYNALFGKVNYNWADKYIFNFTMRRDGSSRFGKQNQFHNFWSIGAAWLLSSESLLKNNISLLSFGKLRASYGTTGNDQIGDYQFLTLYNNISAPIPYQGAAGLMPSNIPNPYLSWEETRKLQLGMDLGFIKDKIMLSTTYYRNRTSNQLLSYSLPLTTGFQGITRNFPAIVQNYGWEITANTVNITSNNFKWFTNVNVTIPQNKLVDFPNLSQSSYSSALVINKPITIFPAYKFRGVDPLTGIYQFQDKDGKITSSPKNLTDRTILINTAPTIYGGVQNNFRFKGFELSVHFQFVKQKGQNYFFGALIPGTYFGTIGNQPSYALQRWKEKGDHTSIQKFTSLFFSDLTQSWQYATFSDAAWSDASYIRLKNFSVSWQLPASWLKKSNIHNCKIYTQGQNLLTITNYKGLDPETRNSFVLPPLRVITVGILTSF